MQAMLFGHNRPLRHQFSAASLDGVYYKGLLLFLILLVCTTSQLLVLGSPILLPTEPTRSMDSYAARQPPLVEGEKPVTVLVTGFGPFLDKYPKNSSWEIASTLPALIPASTENPTPIRIKVHHEPIRVAYQNIINTIPKILPPTSEESPAPDIVLHIGLAAARDFFAIEQGAHSRGYGKTADVDGGLFSDAKTSELFPSPHYPTVLHTGFDTDDVLTRWRSNLKRCAASSTSIPQLPDVRIHSDAGNFLCGFTYYNSLAHYYDLHGYGGERPVVFMHVPDLSGEAKLKEGWEVAVALIKALVESKKEVGVSHYGVEEGMAVQEDDSRNNKAA